MKKQTEAERNLAITLATMQGGEQSSRKLAEQRKRVTQQLEAIGDKGVVQQKVNRVIAHFKGKVISREYLLRLFDGQRISVSMEITDEELKQMFAVALQKYQVEVVDTLTSQETKNSQALEERVQLQVEVIAKPEIELSLLAHIFNIIRVSPDFNNFTNHEIYSTLLMVLGKYGIKVSKDK